MARIELAGGQWADIRDRVNHATDKMLTRAVREARRDPDASVDFDTLIIRAMVTAWHVMDDQGTPVDLVLEPLVMAPLVVLADQACIDRADGLAMEALAEACAAQWVRVTVPNSPTPDSSAASQ